MINPVVLIHISGHNYLLNSTVTLKSALSSLPNI